MESRAGRPRRPARCLRCRARADARATWFDAGHSHWGVVLDGGGRREATVTRLADELRRVTGPSDLVAAYGLNWNPAVFYYAHRKGHMVAPANESFAFDLIQEGAYRYLIAAVPDETDLDFISRWRWIGALGEHTYALADEPGELSGAPFVSTQRGPTVDAHLFQAARVASQRTLDCDRPERIHAGSQGTWLVLREPPRKARIAVPTLAPLPVRGLVFVAAELAHEGSVTIACRGTDRLAIARVVDAGPVG